MRPFYYYLAIILFICSCKKDDSIHLKEISISDAKKSYSSIINKFNINNSLGLVDTLPIKLDWDKCYAKKINGEFCLILDIHPTSTQQIKQSNGGLSSNIERYFLFRKNREGNIKFELVVFVANKDPKNGLSIFVFDNYGKLSCNFVSDGVKLFTTDLEIIQNLKPLLRIYTGAVCIETDWYTCFSYRGVDYGCNYNYTTRQCVNTPDNGGGSLHNNNSITPTGSGHFDYNLVPAIPYTRWVVAPAPDRLISDIKKYLGCFTINNAATYNVTLYVKQPIPNSRIIVSDGYGNKLPSSLDLNSLTVGHSFLGFTQSGANIPSVSRYVGFYPSTMVSPFLPVTPGAIADNSNTDYDVSITFKVSGKEFKAIMEQFQAETKNDYNLNWNNCTDVCINSLNVVGLNIPRTLSTWPLGKGVNPADLGEDLRLFKSNYIKQKNLSGGKSLSNSSQCK
jgi:hypothetical protein